MPRTRSKPKTSKIPAATVAAVDPAEERIELFRALRCQLDLSCEDGVTLIAFAGDNDLRTRARGETLDDALDQLRRQLRKDDLLGAVIEKRIEEERRKVERLESSERFAEDPAIVEGLARRRKLIERDEEMLAALASLAGGA